MTSDDLADKVAEYLNSLEDTLIEFEAVNPPEVGEFLKEKRNTFAVFVIPESESEEPFDRGDTCNEHLTVGVVINGPMKNMTKKLAMQFGKQLRRALCETDFDGYTWQGNDVVTPIDFAALKDNGQFLSRFNASYYGIA